MSSDLTAGKPPWAGPGQRAQGRAFSVGSPGNGPGSLLLLVAGPDVCSSGFRVQTCVPAYVGATKGTT